MTSTTRMTRMTLAGGAALALALSLSACSDDSSQDADRSTSVTTASDGSEFNQADVDFATRMIPHHAQAVQMVVMAQGRPLSTGVAELMDDIRNAQVPEIETMADWLVAWDEPVPETSLDHSNAENGQMPGMDDMGDMVGMMSEGQMDDLDSAADSGFEAMWLEMMEEHHDGAITMAKQEISDGHNPDAIALAEDIVTSQTAEIALMEELR